MCSIQSAGNDEREAYMEQQAVSSYQSSLAFIFPPPQTFTVAKITDSTATTLPKATAGLGGRDNQAAARNANLHVALRRRWSNRKYGTGKLRFPSAK